jgi:aldehyde dehydrogenase (NAD+)
VSTSSSMLDRHARAAEALPNGDMLIGGEWRAADGSASEHVNPSVGRAQGTFAMAMPADIDEAVSAARAALPAWKAMPVDERRRLLLDIAQGLIAAADEFKVIAALENGQPSAQARAAAIRAADQFQYYAGWTDKIDGRVPAVYPGHALDFTKPEPYGVIAALTTWNGPVTAIGRKIAPALATGNTVVLKAPELAPYSSQRFAQVCVAAGLPRGVLSVLTGGPDVGSYLVAHSEVDKIHMTGSPATARKIMAASAAHLTPQAFELGGKSANIVFGDADLDKAAAFAATMGTARNAGQGCVLPTRLLVDDVIYDEFTAKVVGVANSVRMGDPLDADTVMGPLISSAACERVLGTIRDAVANSYGRLLTGGERGSGALADGFFVKPTVFGDVDNQSSLAQEEIFGPVLSIIRFKTEEQAIELANATRYALAGYVFTNDLNRAIRVSDQIDAGYISVNGANPMPPTAPFGGHRDSGFGREGGREGLSEFLRHKNFYIAL